MTSDAGLTPAALFYRQITPGDFWNIERASGVGPETGGGQTYIDVPLGGALSASELWRFLGAPEPLTPADAWPARTIAVKTVGKPEEQAPLEFGPRQSNSRYKISNQNRHRRNARHPAWTARNGFPQAPASARRDQMPEVASLRIYVVKTVDGDYYAGYVNADCLPDGWPTGFGLERLFDRGRDNNVGVIEWSGEQALDLPPLVTQVFEAWRRKPNVLLYGPSGTGKTHAMQLIWDILSGDRPPRRLLLQPHNGQAPFAVGEVAPPFPLPVHREWVTFHQNYSYENFVLALRPEPAPSGFTLKPRMGALLDAAVRADPTLANPGGVAAPASLICIDEVNRGNVSRIFGEFITFMDRDYRATVDGCGNRRALPVPLSNVKVEEDADGRRRTEPIETIDGLPVRLPAPWNFPEHVYLLASMNSVDRAVAPLDTALARRFVRIEVPPDLQLLAAHLGLPSQGELLSRWQSLPGGLAEVHAMAEQPAGRLQLQLEEAGSGYRSGAGAADLVDAVHRAPTIGEIAWFLLYRLNYELAASLGPDFELGHTYLWEVGRTVVELDRLRALAGAWDQAIYPQLRERYINRPDELLRLLRLAAGDTPPTQFLLKTRPLPAGGTSSSSARKEVLESVRLEQFVPDRPDDVKLTLRYLAGV